MYSEPSLDAEFSHLLRGEVLNLAAGNKANVAGLTKTQSDAVTKLSQLPAFKNVLAAMQQQGDALKEWLTNENAEMVVPQLYSLDGQVTAIHKCMLDLLVVHALRYGIPRVTVIDGICRPDRFLAAAHLLVTAVFDAQFMPNGEKEMDLESIVANEVTSAHPVLMCSAPGYDASGRVEDLATQKNKSVVGIAIGMVD